MARTARWTRAQITRSQDDGSVLLTLHITRRWRKDLVVQVEIPLDDASSIQAQLDRHLSGGWQRAQGQRPDSWARSHAEQTARYRGEI